MARDDAHVVIYRILAYLYACLKQGERPTETPVSAQQLGINQRYWLELMAILHDKGLTEGGFERIGGVPYVWVEDMRITLDGIAYMQENTAMQKALSFLRTLKDVISGI